MEDTSRLGGEDTSKLDREQFVIICAVFQFWLSLNAIGYCFCLFLWSLPF